MAYLQIVGKLDGVAVLERFSYHSHDDRFILVINPVHWRQVDQSTKSGRLLVDLERLSDGALFTVPVYRTLAQLRARTRITREPRRLYREQKEDSLYCFTRRSSRESGRDRRSLGQESELASKLRVSSQNVSGSEERLHVPQAVHAP